MRHAAVLLLVMLSDAAAWGEGAEARHQPADSGQQLYGVTTMLHVPGGGLVTVGGSNLRYLAPGAKSFESLLQVPGDSLYRAAGTKDGAIVAAWEKDPDLHYFSPPPRQHLTCPKPAASSDDIYEFHVEYVGFYDERSVLVHMSGLRKPMLRKGLDSVYRIPLDGSPPQLLYEVHDAVELDMTRQRGVFKVPKRPGQMCEHLTCDPVASVDAYELTERGVVHTRLVNGDDMPLGNARMIWGAGEDAVVMELSLKGNARSLLRWNPGDAAPRIVPFTGRNTIGETLFATRSGDVLQVIPEYRKELSIRRLSPDGTESTSRIPAPTSRASWDQNVYKIGQRGNGQLWMHWGDNLLVFKDGLDKAPVAFNIESLIARKTEWAGAAVYLEKPETLWVGLDGRGRSFVRVDFAEALRRGHLWPTEFAAAGKAAR